MGKIDKKIAISPDALVHEAMAVIENSGMQIALIIKSGKLLGTITDGDIRRGFLKKKINIKSKIKLIYNRKFHYLYNTDNLTKKNILSIMKKKELRHLPVIDNKGYFKDVFFINNLLKETNNLCDVVIMAGGKGTRLGNLTRTCPKPMLKINNKPILEIILNECKKQGFENFYISVNYLKHVIKNHFKNGHKFDVKIDYLEESSYLGTAGALSLIKKKINKALIVINGDVLTKVDLNNLINFHNNQKSDFTICVKEHVTKIPFGVVEVDKSTVINLNEKPSLVHFINSGIYMMSEKILKIIPKNKHFEMTDLIHLAKKKNYKIRAFPVIEYWQDLGNLNDFIEVKKGF